MGFTTCARDTTGDLACLDCTSAERYSYGHSWRCTMLPKHGPLLLRDYLRPPELMGPRCAQREGIPAPFWCPKREEPKPSTTHAKAVDTGADVRLVEPKPPPAGMPDAVNAWRSLSGASQLRAIDKLRNFRFDNAPDALTWLTGPELPALYERVRVAEAERVRGVLQLGIAKSKRNTLRERVAELEREVNDLRTVYDAYRVCANDAETDRDAHKARADAAEAQRRELADELAKTILSEIAPTPTDGEGPASPLPFDIEHKEGERLCQIVDGIGGWVASDVCTGDVEYIVHACNARPGLVADVVSLVDVVRGCRDFRRRSFGHDDSITNMLPEHLKKSTAPAANLKKGGE